MLECACNFLESDVASSWPRVMNVLVMHAEQCILA